MVKTRLPWLLAVAILALAFASEAVAQPAQGADENIQYLDKQIQDLKRKVGELAPGNTKFLLSGYAFAGFANAEKEDSSFNAGFNPIFLWKVGDDLLFEGEIEVELEDDETEVGLEYAHATYIVNDYLTLGVGKFLNPSNSFIERLHPAWINKLPDKPLPFGHDGIIAPTQLGAQARGAADAGPFKVGYALYVSNGPALNEGDDTDEGEAMHAGTLEFNKYEDINNGKAVGGHLAVFLLPELEVGYGLEWARVSTSGTALSPSKVDAVVHAVDLNYSQAIEPLSGRVDIRGQWVWSRVESADGYEIPDGAGGSTTLAIAENNRNGGYAQIAYRPSQADAAFVKNSELVFRFDRIDTLEVEDAGTPAPSLAKEEVNRYAFGYNYWVGPSGVLKLAYEITDQDGAPEKINSFLVQGALGF